MQAARFIWGRSACHPSFRAAALSRNWQRGRGDTAATLRQRLAADLAGGHSGPWADTFGGDGGILHPLTAPE